MLPFWLNHELHVPFHIFLPSSHRNHLQKGNNYKISASKCLLDFSSLIISISVCLLSTSFPSIYQQLTKLHQLAMQQSPFPIAHSNQGFQGRWTDWKRECDCCRFVTIRLVNTLMGFLCISSAGMDASAQTGSHELTIPNDVSLISAYLLCLCFLCLSCCKHVFTSFSFLSSLAASLAVRVQRSMRSARCQGLRSRLPTLWRALLTDRSPSLAPTPVSAWLSTWSMPGKPSAKRPSQNSKLTGTQSFRSDCYNCYNSGLWFVSVGVMVGSVYSSSTLTAQ